MLIRKHELYRSGEFRTPPDIEIGMQVTGIESVRDERAGVLIHDNRALVKKVMVCTSERMILVYSSDEWTSGVALPALHNRRLTEKE